MHTHIMALPRRRRQPRSGSTSATWSWGAWHMVRREYRRDILQIWYARDRIPLHHVGSDQIRSDRTTSEWSAAGSSANQSAQLRELTASLCDIVYAILD